MKKRLGLGLCGWMLALVPTTMAGELDPGAVIF